MLFLEHIADKRAHFSIDHPVIETQRLDREIFLFGFQKTLGIAEARLIIGCIIANKR